MARKQQKERSSAVRKLILDAALDITNEQGLDRLTVRNISERIGYSTGVIYYHFENKQDIIDALHIRRDEESYKHVRTLIKEDSCLYDNVQRIMRYIASMALEKKEAYYRMFSSRRLPGEEYAHEIWLKLAEEVIGIAVRRGELENSDIKKKARCLLGFYLGFDILFLELHPLDRKSTLDFADTVSGIIINGLK